MIGRGLGLGFAMPIPQMVRQLGAQRPLDQRFLEPTRRGFDVGRRERAIADNLIEDFSRDRRQDLGARLRRFRFAGHTDSSCYAPHTKSRTLSPKPLVTLDARVCIDQRVDALLQLRGKLPRDDLFMRTPSTRHNPY